MDSNVLFILVLIHNATSQNKINPFNFLFSHFFLSQTPRLSPFETPIEILTKLNEEK